jgi:hypothetical protein
LLGVHRLGRADYRGLLGIHDSRTSEMFETLPPKVRGGAKPKAAEFPKPPGNWPCRRQAACLCRRKLTKTEERRRPSKEEARIMGRRLETRGCPRPHLSHAGVESGDEE